MWLTLSARQSVKLNTELGTLLPLAILEFCNQERRNDELWVMFEVCPLLCEVFSYAPGWICWFFPCAPVLLSSYLHSIISILLSCHYQGTACSESVFIPRVVVYKWLNMPFCSLSPQLVQLS
jgi:hypothetical protein